MSKSISGPLRYIEDEDAGQEVAETRIGDFIQSLRLIFWLMNRLAPYERRVIELLRNSKDKRARKLAKKRVCGHLIFR